MKLSEQIKQRQIARQTAIAAMERLVNTVEGESRAFTDDEQTLYDTYKQEVDSADTALVRLHEMEKMVGRELTPTAAVVSATGGVKNRQPAGLMIGALASLIRAHVEKISPEEAARRSYSGDGDIEKMVRAVSAPAQTNVSGWASELVQDGVSQFVELIRPLTIYGQVPGLRLEFADKGAIPLPTFEAGRLSGDFIAEGAPIPVKQGLVSSTSMGPNKLAVISSFTREMAQHSNPSIEALIRSAILADTAEVLDLRFTDNVAASAVRPAGLQNAVSTGAGNINAAIGTGTQQDILDDVKGVMSRMFAARAGTVGAWIMSPTTKLGLEFLQTALGTTAFPSVSSGSFAGAPILTTDQIANNIVIAVASSAMAFGNDFSPEFKVSDQATLHMEDTTPLAISTAGVPNVVAAPVRSMFQTDSIALRMCWGLAWKQIRAGGVQVLTGVAWG